MERELAGVETERGGVTCERGFCVEFRGGDAGEVDGVEFWAEEETVESVAAADWAGARAELEDCVEGPEGLDWAGKLVVTSDVVVETCGLWVKSRGAGEVPSGGAL